MTAENQAALNLTMDEDWDFLKSIAHKVKKESPVPTIKECIARVNKSNGLSCDECHASTKIVSTALAGREIEQCKEGTLETWLAELERVAKTSECKVYRVDIEELGHSIAVAQCGAEVAVMQSWIFCYTLQHWMIGTDEKFKNNSFLPKGGVDYSVLSSFITTLAKNFEARRIDEIVENCCAIFSLTGTSYTILTMAITFKAGVELSVTWGGLPIQ